MPYKTSSSAKENSTTSKVIKVMTKAGLHKRNLHRGNYDFDRLVKAEPALSAQIIVTPNGLSSIDFSDPYSVKILNKALLNLYYKVKFWDIPKGYLCPPIPGRADYIHRLSDLLFEDYSDTQHNRVRALDIGTGANAVYPIIGSTQYQWQCVGSDIDPVSVSNVVKIIKENSILENKVECRLQNDTRRIFKGIIGPNEYYEVSICNPPFHKSLKEAQVGTNRKINNLAKNRAKRGQESEPTSVKESANKLNFGGQRAELWCPGGEARFVKDMALESRHFSSQVLWFSTLISKKENVRWLRKNLEKVGAEEIKIIEMKQGNKQSRFVAWTFHPIEKRHQWLKSLCS